MHSVQNVRKRLSFIAFSERNLRLSIFNLLEKKCYFFWSWKASLSFSWNHAIYLISGRIQLYANIYVLRREFSILCLPSSLYAPRDVINTQSRGCEFSFNRFSDRINTRCARVCRYYLALFHDETWYTPVSMENSEGSLSVVVKRYNMPRKLLQLWKRWSWKM